MTESWCPRVLPFTAAPLPFSCLSFPRFPVSFPRFPVSFPCFPASFPSSPVPQCPFGYFPSLLSPLSSAFLLLLLFGPETSPTSQSLTFPHFLSLWCSVFQTYSLLPLLHALSSSSEASCFGVSYSFSLVDLQLPSCLFSQNKLPSHFSSAVKATSLHLFHLRLSPWAPLGRDQSVRCLRWAWEWREKAQPLWPLLTTAFLTRDLGQEHRDLLRPLQGPHTYHLPQ